MRLKLEVELVDDRFYGACGCGKWNVVRDKREDVFAAWGIHCQAKHHPKQGVDTPEEE